MQFAAKPPVVLVVEDEPLALMLAMDVIEEEGFIAIPAPNAEEALSLMESRGDIQIIFTDVNMRGSMDGVELAVAVRDRWPPVKILLTSGWPLNQPDLLPTGVQFLPKPYTASIFTKMLRELAA